MFTWMVVIDIFQPKPLDVNLYALYGILEQALSCYFNPFALFKKRACPFVFSCIYTQIAVRLQFVKLLPWSLPGKLKYKDNTPHTS